MKLKLGTSRKYALVLKSLPTGPNRREAILTIARHLRMRPSAAAALVKTAPVRLEEHKRKSKLAPLGRSLRELGAEILVCEVAAGTQPAASPAASAAQSAHAAHEGQSPAAPTKAGDPLENLLADLKEQNLIAPEVPICEACHRQTAKGPPEEAPRAADEHKSGIAGKPLPLELG